MPRVTLDIDALILDELKCLKARERKSLGKLVSELLADALARLRRRAEPPPPFTWIARPMGARIDLADKGQLWAVGGGRKPGAP